MDEGGIMDEIGLNRQNEFYLYETQHKGKFTNLDISNKTSQTFWMDESDNVDNMKRDVTTLHMNIRM